MRIDIDTCEEILITITRNKTRSLLTAFGVFWGIFMLVALIGGGQGMQEELKSQFEGFATNSGFIAAQKTSEAYKGFRKGRWWDLEMEDVDRVRNVDGVALATPSIALWGQVAVYGDNKYDCSVKGLYPEYEQIEHQEMTYGRFINDVDIKESRKVCVIGKRVYESLFKPGEDPCGKYVRVNGIYYRVIGMCSSEGNVNIQGQASEAITLPFSTMQQTYNLGKKLHVVCFIMKPGVKVKDVQPEVERLVKAAHYIAPDDKQAVMLLNAEAMFSMMDNLMIGVRFLIWMVGLGTLFAGAIGVSNIMMVTVKERTTEIGIRRAIGARPKDILQQILSESMVLTTIAGMAGISFAVFVLQILEKAANDPGVIKTHYQVSFGLAIGTCILLIALGVLAGLAPAYRAMAIKPINCHLTPCPRAVSARRGEDDFRENGHVVGRPHVLESVGNVRVFKHLHSVRDEHEVYRARQPALGVGLDAYASGFGAVVRRLRDVARVAQKPRRLELVYHFLFARVEIAHDYERRFACDFRHFRNEQIEGLFPVGLVAAVQVEVEEHKLAPRKFVAQFYPRAKAVLLFAADAPADRPLFGRIRIRTEPERAAVETFEARRLVENDDVHRPAFAVRLDFRVVEFRRPGRAELR